MKEIGGYFELELCHKAQYHDDLLKLNSGRNAIKYILKTQTPHKVYIPSFVCDSVIEPLEALNVDYDYYNVNDEFEIVQDITLQRDDRLLYVNYFAMKSKYIKRLVKKFGNKLIVDNTQAFYEKPHKAIDTIYSPRKFFGVSDGGYLNTQMVLPDRLQTDTCYDYVLQLVGRIDKDASSFYAAYQQSEERLANQPVKKMSKFTEKILSSIDYENIRKIRRENFDYLSQKLKDTNLIKIDDIADGVPFVYPYMTEKRSLRERLIRNKIYVAKYWDEVLKRDRATMVEKNMVENILPLPIDQRYDLDDMAKIVELLLRKYD